MRLLITSLHPHVIARELCDAHLRGMVVEAGQLLSTVTRLNQGMPGVLKKTRRPFETPRIYQYDYVLHELGENGNDPIIHLATNITSKFVKWGMASSENYEFAYDIFKALQLEYMHRFLKPHPSHEMMPILYNTPPQLPVVAGTVPPMPDDFPGDSVPEKYQSLLLDRYRQWARINEGREGKIKRVRWTNRPVPDWVDGETLDLIRANC